MYLKSLVSVDFVFMCICLQTAEKRKTMLDDMAIQLNQEKSDHKEALSDLKLQHEKEVRH